MKVGFSTGRKLTVHVRGQGREEVNNNYYIINIIISVLSLARSILLRRCPAPAFVLLLFGRRGQVYLSFYTALLSLRSTDINIAALSERFIAAEVLGQSCGGPAAKNAEDELRSRPSLCLRFSSSCFVFLSSSVLCFFSLCLHFPLFFFLPPHLQR